MRPNHLLLGLLGVLIITAMTAVAVIVPFLLVLAYICLELATWASPRLGEAQFKLTADERNRLYLTRQKLRRLTDQRTAMLRGTPNARVRKDGMYDERFAGADKINQWMTQNQPEIDRLSKEGTDLSLAAFRRRNDWITVRAGTHALRAAVLTYGCLFLLQIYSNSVVDPGKLADGSLFLSQSGAYVLPSIWSLIAALAVFGFVLFLSGCRLEQRVPQAELPT